MLDAALHSITVGKLEDAQSVLASALDRQRATIRELRDLSFALEPVVLRDQGFAPALQELAEQIGTANRIRIDLDIAAAEEIGEAAQVATYTIIRELLDQAIRRGPPTTVQVSMKATEDGGLETCVADNAEPERRYRQTIHRVDLWSVLKISVCFYICGLAVTMVALVALWAIADAAGVIHSVEKFLGDLLQTKDFTFLDAEILRGTLLVAAVLVVLLVVITVIAAAFYNMFAELFGGVELTITEEETTL